MEAVVIDHAGYQRAVHHDVVVLRESAAAIKVGLSDTIDETDARETATTGGHTDRLSMDFEGVGPTQTSVAALRPGLRCGERQSREPTSDIRHALFIVYTARCLESIWLDGREPCELGLVNVASVATADMRLALITISSPRENISQSYTAVGCRQACIRRQPRGQIAINHI